MVVSGRRLHLIKNSEVLYHHKGNNTVVLRYNQELSNGRTRPYYYTAILTGNKFCYMEKVTKTNEYVLKALKKNGNQN